MNLKERATMVRAMETVMRNLNDEEVFEGWLMDGVADGDIDEKTTDEDLEWYCKDESFASLMDTFCWVMKNALKTYPEEQAVFYCDKIVSRNQ